MKLFSIDIIYIYMKITIDNLIKFMRKKENVIITDEQVEKIKEHFYKDVEDLVYYFDYDVL